MAPILGLVIMHLGMCGFVHGFFSFPSVTQGTSTNATRQPQMLDCGGEFDFFAGK